jgi:hypothetical protein
MNDILIVTGTCGVGKSSVCWEWSGRRQGAVIHCDAFRTWIRKPGMGAADSYQEPLLARHAVSLACDYLDMGLDVAIDNVWTPDGLGFLQAELNDKGRIKVFWLTCGSEENHRRDDTRSPSDVMGGRVDELQGELDAMVWPGYVTRLDTTGLSLGQTVDIIGEHFQAMAAVPPAS